MDVSLMVNIIILIAVLGAFIMLIVLYFSGRKGKDEQGNKELKESILDIERRLTDILNQKIRDVEGSVHQNSSSLIEKFAKTTVELKDDISLLKKELEGINSFQEIFKAPKLRGEWGEAHLEYILRQHYPEEFYETQYMFSSGERVDAVLKFPNGKLLPIDSKFPIESFLRIQQAKNQEEKDVFRKQFVDDVLRQIDDIASKYIRPQEGTTEVAIMYIPAEALYYELLHHSGKFDILSKAFAKKVVITSPNTLFLTLRVVENWINQDKISKKTLQIIKKLSAIQKDTEKLKDDFRRLGSHIKNAQSAYESADKRLELWGGKVESVLELEDGNKKIEKENNKG